MMKKSNEKGTYGMAEPKPRPALDHSLLGAALAQVRDTDAWWADRSCLIFMALTCVRSGEAREATWDEVDMAAGIWTIPGSRMKSGFSHRVPLSTQAKEILTHARAQTDPSESRIFPPQRGSAYINASKLSSLLRRMELQTVPHGFRASFRNWAGERLLITDFVASMVLGHKLPPVLRELHRPSDLFKERQPIMQAWGDYVTETMGPSTPTTEE